MVACCHQPAARSPKWLRFSRTISSTQTWLSCFLSSKVNVLRGLNDVDALEVVKREIALCVGDVDLEVLNVIDAALLLAKGEGK